MKKEGLQYGLFPNRFLVGDILQDEFDRMFIIDCIKGCHPNRKINRTKLLYSFPLMKIINPHMNIDNEPNYVVVMSLSQRDSKGKPYLLAMYSEKALKSKDSTNKENGFVASVTNAKAYERLKSNKNSSLT
jgi:hypothetical protein